MDFKKYKTKSLILEKSILKGIDLCNALEIKTIKETLSEIKGKLNDNTFRVVVVGEFSRGKSTFINALLGRNILPSSVKPTTAVISRIVYGNKPRYFVQYKESKNSKEISEEEFKDIKAQSEVDKSFLNVVQNFNRKGINFSDIDHLKIYYPLMFCKNGVEVVDTPGTNDLYAERIEITYKYINKAEAAVLLLGADQVLSKTEKEFLKEQVLGNNIKDIFIVINYKDLLSEPQAEQEVKQYVIDHLVELGIRDFEKRIFLVSSKEALLFRRNERGEDLKPKQQALLPSTIEETGFPVFEQSLFRFLEEEKGLVKLRKLSDDVKNCLNSLSDIVEMNIETISGNADEVNNDIARILPKIEKAKRKTALIVNAVRQELNNGKSDLRYTTNELVAKLQNNAITAVSTCTENMDGNDLKNLIKRSTVSVQDEIIRNANALQKKYLTKAQEMAVEEIEDLWEGMSLDFRTVPIKTSFNFNFSLTVDKETKKRNKEVGYAMVGAGIGAAVAGPIGFVLGGLFGAAMGEDEVETYTEINYEKLYRQVRKEYDSKCPHLVDSICNQYEACADEFCETLEFAIDGRLEEMQVRLKKLADLKKQKDADFNKEKRRLESIMMKISHIKDELGEV